jgi:hypothetical protein
MDALSLLDNLRHYEGLEVISEPVRGGKVSHGMLES